MSNTAERIIGGYLTPVAIMLGGLVLTQHGHGYLPAFLGPVLLVIALAGTACYRRGKPAYTLRALRRTL